VRTLTVVVVEKDTNAVTTRVPAVGGVQVDVVVFERAPQSLDEHVVKGPSHPVHRDRHVGLEQDAREGRRRELTGIPGRCDSAWKSWRLYETVRINPLRKRVASNPGRFTFWIAPDRARPLRIQVIWVTRLMDVELREVAKANDLPAFRLEFAKASQRDPRPRRGQPRSVRETRGDPKFADRVQDWYLTRMYEILWKDAVQPTLLVADEEDKAAGS
jgi:hypothetical protein